MLRLLPGGLHRLAEGVASVTFDVPILLDIRGEQSIQVNVENEGLVGGTGRDGSRGTDHLGNGDAVRF